MPTPPSPTTMTLWPGSGGAALSRAPPPVSTAQPRTAATSGGTSSSTATTERVSTTAWVANAEHAQVVVHRGPVAAEPAPARRAARRRRCWRTRGRTASARRWRSRRTRPQRGRKVMTTCWPIARSVTPGPSAVTCPLASWPSSIGTGRGSVAVDDGQVGVADPGGGDPGPAPHQDLGPSSSSSPTVSGRVRAQGPGRPTSSRTAPVILMTGPARRGARRSRTATGIGTVAREVRSM